MNRRKRKPLDDALADDFVYGENKTDESPEIDNQPPTPKEVEPDLVTADKKSKESSLMDKLQVKSKEATKRFTVDLAESMHRKLSILAAKTGRSKADIVRLLLDDALKDVEE
ncbi:CopG-like DNA-binding protein [Hyella patelloides LEGE 07179]|uniref:CopG-like DNA-binding protein n=1 Tax=Hyella patelloides LEGE 07179 TaxID=945734 RepID=A0A563VUX4_9CYAN|nr:hypothetical protein [Hyella patelloides]VEP15194.1 CopG-like DNA-binding protein [Hyella patelloides LEGE 07179]